MAVYLLHFDEPIGQMSHYIGWTNNVVKRAATHRKGKGSRLTKILFQKGIGFRVARIWVEGNRSLERGLKDHHRSKDLCPICNLKMRSHLVLEEI